MKAVSELTAQIEEEAQAVAKFHADAQQRLNNMQAEMVQFQAQAEAEINRRNGRIELLKEMVGAGKPDEVDNG